MRNLGALLLILHVSICLSVAQNPIEHVTNGEIDTWEPATKHTNACNTGKFPIDDPKGLGVPAGLVANPIGWSNLMGTPDLYLSCDGMVPVHEVGPYMDHFLPDLMYEDGPKAGFIGLWVNGLSELKMSYREIAQNKLAVPVKPGGTYRLRMRVAVRNQSWLGPTPANWFLSPLDVLNSPKIMTLGFMPEPLKEPFAGFSFEWYPPDGCAFNIIDNEGHGNFIDDAGNPVVYNDRWKPVEYTFTIPATLRKDLSYMFIGPGRGYGEHVVDDVIHLDNPPARGLESLCYVYVDGVSIIETPCTCEDIKLSMRQDETVIGPDEFCCFTVDIENVKRCAVRELKIESSSSISYINGIASQPAVTTYTEDFMYENWTDGKAQSRTYCILNSFTEGARTYVDVTLTLLSGARCQRRFEINCQPCKNCDQNTPRIRIQASKPSFANGQCCYDVVVDNTSGCPKAKVTSLRIFDNGKLVQQSDKQVDLSKVTDNIVFSKICVPVGGSSTFRFDLSLDLNGTVCAVSHEEELKCSCCRATSVTVSSPAGAERLRPDFPDCFPCQPLVLSIRYTGEPLCSEDVVVAWPNGSKRTMKVPINQPAGTTHILAIVCPGQKEQGLIVTIGADCRYVVRIPACTTRNPGDDPKIPPFGKGTVNDQDRGEASTYTLSVTDIRGVSYGTYTGTNIDQLFEQSRSSTLPNGFYVVYVRDARGSLIDRRFFIK